MKKFDLNGHEVYMSLNQYFKILKWIVFNKKKLYKLIDMLDLGWNFHAAYNELNK